jgi:hypothetical protein
MKDLFDIAYAECICYNTNSSLSIGLKMEVN